MPFPYKFSCFQEGLKGDLVKEINGAGEETGKAAVGFALAMFHIQQTLPSFKASPDHYLISSVTKVAPSPDWFTGFSSFDARHVESGVWFEEFVINTGFWDAGTEQGSAFRNNNNTDQSPPKPISLHSLDTFPNDGHILPAAQWTCVMK